MRRLAASVLVLLFSLVALCLFVAVPAATATPVEGEHPPFGDQAQRAELFDVGNSQQIRFQIQPDGDATLVVSFVFDVETEAERAAFRETAAEFKRSGFVWPFFNNTVSSVSAHADREMSLEGPRRTSQVNEQKNIGVLRSRMTWEGFGNVSDGTVLVEDAFYVDDGVPWIRRLGTNQSLVLVGPDGYEFAGAPDGPRFSDERLIWEGRQQFEDGDLRARWTRERAAPSIDPGIVGLVTVFVLLLVLALYAVRRNSTTGPSAEPTRDPRPDEPVADTDGGAPATDAPPSDAAIDQESAPPGPRAASEASAPAQEQEQIESTAEEEVDESETETEKEPDDDIDPELLSDEERVERMLDRNGGRMKQANIVKETGWSNAKVSQLLSQMDEDDRIDKLRIGRENLISLPDEDITTLE